MQVERGLFQTAMTKQQLNGTQVCSRFQQVRCEAVLKLCRDLISKPGWPGSLSTNRSDHFRRDRLLAGVPAIAGKQPYLWSPAESVEVAIQFLQQSWAEHHVAIFAAFSTFDVNDHPLPVDVAHL
jgi:hypothetical protein